MCYLCSCAWLHFIIFYIFRLAVIPLHSSVRLSRLSHLTKACVWSRLNVLCLLPTASRGDKEVWNNGLLWSLSWRSKAIACRIRISSSAIHGKRIIYHPYCIQLCLPVCIFFKTICMCIDAFVNYTKLLERFSLLQVMADDYGALLIPQDIHRIWPDNDANTSESHCNRHSFLVLICSFRFLVPFL